MVACSTLPPASNISAWRSASYAIARSIKVIEFMFFISVRVPSTSLPSGRREIFTSHRIEPSCILQSDTPIYRMMSCSFSTYSRASSGEEMSGSDTISMSGTPPRL